jgi:hypothetical protein
MADLRILPIWLPGYRRGCLASDLVAGLIVWSVKKRGDELEDVVPDLRRRPDPREPEWTDAR